MCWSSSGFILKVKKMKRFLLVFLQQYQTFREAEFKSLCSYFGIKKWKFIPPSQESEKKEDRPSAQCSSQSAEVCEYDRDAQENRSVLVLPSPSTSSETSASTMPETMCVVYLPCVSDLRSILSRSVLIRFGCELWAEGASYSSLHSNLKHVIQHHEDVFHEDQSYSIRVMTVGRKKSQAYGLKRIDGRVELSNPSSTFYVVEDHIGAQRANRPKAPSNSEETDLLDTMNRVFFGTLVGSGQMMPISKYNLVERKFIGNTSMDPVLATIQANLARVGPHSLAIDPFVGTGSLLIAAAHFGSYCIGTEINYNIVHGLGRSSRANMKYREPDESVKANFKQYGMEGKFLDVLLADASRSDLWRWKSSFDAILADPPYGIREKCAKLGYRKGQNNQNIAEQVQHYPGKTKYHFKDVLLDLLNFAAEYLGVGGRLTYWLPVINNDYTEATVPQHPCLALLHNCEQRIARVYGRRLITMEKLEDPQKSEHDKAFLLENPYEEQTLRDKIFNVTITKERKWQPDNRTSIANGDT